MVTGPVISRAGAAADLLGSLMLVRLDLLCCAFEGIKIIMAFHSSEHRNRCLERWHSVDWPYAAHHTVLWTANTVISGSHNFKWVYEVA